jgi:group I intron endonuclease
MGCVYLATNTVTMDQYVGFTSKTLGWRRKTHYRYAYRGLKGYFNSAIRKYGEAAFFWIGLFDSDDVDILKAKEIHYIAEYSPVYNMTKGGDGAVGCIRSEETRRKMSEWQIGRKMSEESKLKMSKAKTGKKHGPMSDETKRKLSETHIGRPKSEQTRRKISETLS